MLKCRHGWLTDSAQALAIHHAIFDSPTGHTSWEVMRWPFRRNAWGAGTHFAMRHLFF
jgi:hypothetical protein